MPDSIQGSHETHKKSLSTTGCMAPNCWVFICLDDVGIFNFWMGLLRR